MLFALVRDLTYPGDVPAIQVMVSLANWTDFHPARIFLLNYLQAIWAAVFDFAEQPDVIRLHPGRCRYLRLAGLNQAARCGLARRLTYLVSIGPCPFPHFEEPVFYFFKR